jgi:hypothetical protein
MCLHYARFAGTTPWIGPTGVDVIPAQGHIARGAIQAEFLFGAVQQIATINLN